MLINLFAPAAQSEVINCEIYNASKSTPNKFNHNCISSLKDQNINRSHLLGNSESYDWQPITTKQISFGLSDTPYWFKIKGNIEQGNWIWKIDYPLTDQIEIWRIDNSEVVEQLVVGDTLPFSQRPVPHPEFIIPFESSGKSQQQLWIIKVTNSGSMKLPLTILSADTFWPEIAISRMVNGGFIAIFVVIILYNLLLGFIVKDTDYFIYVGYVTSFLLYTLSVQADGFQFLWPNHPELNNVLPLASTELVATFATLFFYRFVSVHEKSKRTRIFFKILIGWGVFSILFSIFAPYRLALTLVFTNNLTFSPALFFFAVYWTTKGDENAKIFLIAWSLLIIGFTTVAFHTLGLVPDTFLTRNASQIGAVIEVVMLSLALARKIELARQNQIHAERLLATKENESKRKQIQSLEQLVVGISHELNTPLGNAKMASEVLASDTNPEQRLQCANLINSSLTRMANLIAEFKKVSVTQFDSAMEKSDLNSWLNQWLKVINTRHPDLEINLITRFKELELKTSPLQIILDQLVSNSFHHGKKEQEKLKITLKVFEKDGVINFSYRDNGPGINFEDAHKITDAFYTTNRGNDQSTGLGLYVVANFISHFYNGHFEFPTNKPGFCMRFNIQTDASE